MSFRPPSSIRSGEAKEERKEAHRDEPDRGGSSSSSSASSSSMELDEVKDEKTPLHPPATITVRRPRERGLRPFYQYQWLDVRDKENQWLEAQIIELSPRGNEFKIHYKGWAAKHDEWLNGAAEHLDSIRIAPFHAHTTGPPRSIPLSGGVAPPSPLLFEPPPEPGLRVDVRDTLDDWIQGTVVAVDELHDMVRIHYEGWDSKFDEWLNSETDRVAQAYTYIRAPPGTVFAPTTPTAPTAPPAFLPTTSDDRPERKAYSSEDNERNFKMILAKERGFTIVEQKDDGNCLFRSVAHQVYGDPEAHAVVRAKCMAFIEVEQWFFQSYIAERFDVYVARLKNDGEWGDHVEIHAMSKIYNRPVEIYAYRTTPLVSNQTSRSRSSPPIRLSYHFQSHYNSVINQSSHLSTCFTSVPGVLEDDALRIARLSGGTEEERQAQRMSDLEATEMEALRTAMGHSRDDATRGSTAAFDRIVQQSLAEFTQRFEKEMSEAKARSESEMAEKEIIAATIKESEEELLNRIKATSKAEHKATAPTAADDEVLRKALAQSAADELKRVMQISLIASKELPDAVQRCLAAGFPLDQCEIAYTIYASTRVPQEKVASNMIDWLRAQAAPSSPFGGGGMGMGPTTGTGAAGGGGARGAEYKAAHFYGF